MLSRAVTFLARLSAPLRRLAPLAFSLSILATGSAILLAPRAAADQAAAFALSETMAQEQLIGHLELLEDKTGQLDIADVAVPSAAFQLASLKSTNIGFTPSVWWARLTLRNASDQRLVAMLRQTYPLIDYVDLYERAEDGNWQRHSTGDRRKFAERDIAHRDFIFPLAVPAGQDRTYYLRYQSQGPIDISLSLTSPAKLVAGISREQLAYGIYYGAVIMLLVWSMLVFVAVRDKAFLAYFAYVACFGLYMATHNGLAFQFLWPNSPTWGNTGLIVLLCASLLSALQFARMILHARDYAPRLDKLAKALQGVALLALLAAPILPYATLIVPVTLLILLSVVFMLIMGCVSAMAGSIPARYFLLAWGAFLAGSIIYLWKIFGVLPHTFMTQNSWQIGSLLEMILLSLTLSSRMNELQHQSRTDALTQLGNRRLFDDKLPAATAVAIQQRKPLALLVLDIDHFKQFNDRHGHAQGDEAIKRVAHALRKHVRKPYLACRYGGEEFAVILPGASHDDARVLAERLRSTVQGDGADGYPITISIGVGSLEDCEEKSADKLFEATDFALYTAKEQGRNCCVSFRDCQSRRDESNAAGAAPTMSPPTMNAATSNT
ncbi:GGDEF domain-containing protein [Permianibacter sp. IMCC34836]|uniref:sensor domain-containing diguanylate cyclase n=1 Tax=Permianibacter fluminis TaxID=2738515 RepID=UPI0015528EF1|nr:diguanylate cyclase [Permianibacter fluminis]NQD39067.1 GGDEF domain-containing protein [Permianibacter fluminis]